MASPKKTRVLYGGRGTLLSPLTELCQNMARYGERREILMHRTLRETLNNIPRCFIEVNGQGELAPYVFQDTK